MGDPRRFDALADEVMRYWPDRSLRIADVSAGKGKLHAALHQRGYHSVTCFDRRPRKAKRPHFRYRLFTADEPERFDLVVAMHPDAGTDEAIEYARRHALPFLVVPCCTRPSAWAYDGNTDYESWFAHLVAHCPDAQMGRLAITGANRFIRHIPDDSEPGS